MYFLCDVTVYNMVTADYQTGEKHGSIHFMLGALFPFSVENSTKEACSSHARMTRMLPWHAVSKVKASPCFSRTSTH